MQQVSSGRKRPPGPRSAPTLARGFRRAGDPRVWGATVGAAGASVFVLAHQGELADPWPAVAVGAWVLALVATTWVVFLAPRAFDEPLSTGPHVGITYLCGVVIMLLVIRGGTTVLDDDGRSALRPALVVMAVGLHFLPFAAAFRTPVFSILGGVMVVLGTAGLVVGWLGDEVHVAAATAVVAGLVMLVVITSDAGARVCRRCPGTV